MKNPVPLLALALVCGCNTFSELEDVVGTNDEPKELWNQCSEAYGEVERVKSASITATKATSGFSMAFHDGIPYVAFTKGAPTGVGDLVEVRPIHVREVVDLLDSESSVEALTTVPEVELHVDTQALGTLIALSPGNDTGFSAIQYDGTFIGLPEHSLVCRTTASPGMA